jgi:cell wall-associated NlpC family hydrolase
VAARGGISGLALTAIAGGIVVLWSGLKNVSVSDTLRGFIKGQPPAGVPADTPLSRALAEASTAAQHITLSPSLTNPGLKGAAGSALGAAAAGAAAVAQGAIVNDARKYLGVPYAWGRADANGMDCSGLVNRVIGRDLGLPIPGSDNGSFSGHGPVTGQWYVWGGATTIPASQAVPGDLVCWTSHIGIYVGGGQMINAPSAGKTVRIEKVWNTPAPIYRRLKVT